MLRIDVANAKRGVRHDFAIDAEHDFVRVDELRVRIDRVGADASQDEVARHAAAATSLGHGARQVRIEVVAAGETVVGRQRAGREVVRDARVEIAVVAVDLGACRRPWRRRSRRYAAPSCSSAPSP